MPDPKDLNEDGKVTDAERRKWAKQNSADVTAANWGIDLAVLKQDENLWAFFNDQFKKYQSDPTGFSDKRFMLELRKQPFWQQHSAAWIKDREFELQYPQQYESEVAADVEALRDQASQMGAKVDDGVLRDLVVKQRRGGLNKAQLQNALSGYLTIEQGRFEGAAGKAQDSLKQWATANGIGLSDDTIRKYVSQVAAGDLTEDDVKTDLRKTYLAGMYPAWADKINAGYDPADLFAPYQDTARKLLEDQSIGLDDPIMQKITQGVGPDGKPAVVPLYEAQRMIRQDPRWQKTDNAYATYSSVADDVLKMFGFR